jgi:hypothetical protein
MEEKVEQARRWFQENYDRHLEDIEIGAEENCLNNEVISVKLPETLEIDKLEEALEANGYNEYPFSIETTKTSNHFRGLEVEKNGEKHGRFFEETDKIGLNPDFVENDTARAEILATYLNHRHVHGFKEHLKNEYSENLEGIKKIEDSSLSFRDRVDVVLEEDVDYEVAKEALEETGYSLIDSESMQMVKAEKEENDFTFNYGLNFKEGENRYTFNIARENGGYVPVTEAGEIDTLVTYLAYKHLEE